ncbi:DsbA family protein [Roseovarius sp. CAU 1744]|uniref:DsbA family protein n=1 Tax=Roseovarius sp. CAU 1744 TaxID=3140368 RepID=UPI00325A5557
MPPQKQLPKTTTRRGLFRLAGFAALVGAAYGGAGLLRRLTEPDLVFEPITDLPGFRRVEGGPVSGGATALIGIRGADSENGFSVRLANSAVCTALFGPAPDPSRVQVAYFTDYRCIYCRKLSPMLAAMENAGGIRVNWHELPLLGQISDIAARAALAAREQGAYDVFHKRLMGAQAVPNPPYLRQLADEAGIDGARLLRDMTGKPVLSRLALSSAVAQRFGFFGTPAMVIGRTAVMGGIDQRMIERLVAAEQDATQPAAC